VLPVKRSATCRFSHDARNHLTSTAPLTVAMSSNINRRITGKQASSYHQHSTVLPLVMQPRFNCSKVFKFCNRLTGNHFSALHGMPAQTSDEKGVCPSVCLSNAWMWQNGKKICPDFYTVRQIIYPGFLRRKMAGGSDPFYVKCLVVGGNCRFWTDTRL